GGWRCHWPCHEILQRPARRWIHTLWPLLSGCRPHCHGVWPAKRAQYHPGSARIMMPAHSCSPFRLGLTGGVGSGKSTVAQMRLRLGGCAVLDADQMARTATEAGGAAMEAIARTFGPDFVDASGALNRDRMRTLAFAQPASRKQLEAIVHPLILQMTEDQAAAATAAGHRLLVFDIPLLVESGHWLRKLHAVAVVDCQEQTQIDRVMARSGLD